MTEADREAATLRRSVQRQDFAGVERSLAAYVALVEAGNSPALLAQACDLIEWARRNLRVARTRISQERDRLRAIAHYRKPPAPLSHLFRIDA